jgi:hypothetical protein
LSLPPPKLLSRHAATENAVDVLALGLLKITLGSESGVHVCVAGREALPGCPLQIEVTLHAGDFGRSVLRLALKRRVLASQPLTEASVQVQGRCGFTA